MKLKDDNSSKVILEVRFNSDLLGIVIEPLEIVSPMVVKIKIGKSPIQFSHKILEGLIASLPDIQEVIVPQTISSSSIDLLYPITQLNVPIVYADQNKSGLELGRYIMKVGYLPNELNDVPDGTTIIQDDDIVPTIQDGFRELPFGDLDSIMDGFHEVVPVEKREMWTEDPERMNRLSYIPIAKTLGTDTFPAELGGGSI